MGDCSIVKKIAGDKSVPSEIKNITPDTDRFAKRICSTALYQLITEEDIGDRLRKSGFLTGAVLLS